jgi:hypothetical protein
MRQANGMFSLVMVALWSGCAADMATMDSNGDAMAGAKSPAGHAMQTPGGAPLSAPTNAAQSGGPSAASGVGSGAASGMVPVTPSMQPAPGDMPVVPSGTPPMNECGLTTRFRGDEFCIKPPPEDEGFQLHVGPTDHDNPEPRFILEPTQEVTETFPAVTGNERSVYYFFRQQRMRPGSHHLLVRTNTTNELIVSAQNPISDSPAGGKIAPENEGVGFPLAARTPLSVNVHFINTSDEPILKEVWVNFWYKDASTVTEPANVIFTGVPVNIPPGRHVVLSSDCTVRGSGRILRLFGHKHANNVRWSSYRVRGGQKDLLFEDYEHWEEPLVLEYSSITTNPKADPATKTPGGWSGIVDLQAGDVFRFECEVVNETSRTFTGQNEAVDDEMCIQNGTVVGTTIGAGAGMFGGGGCVSAQTLVQD